MLWLCLSRIKYSSRVAIMDNLVGRWNMEKGLCTGTDALLKLQGINWALRKGIGLASLRLDVSIYKDDQKPDSDVTVVDVATTPTGGLGVTRERRVLDWSLVDHKDYLFGSNQHQTHWIYGVRDSEGRAYPEFELQTKVAKDEDRVKQFMRGEIQEDGKQTAWDVDEPDAEGKHVWLHTFVRNFDTGWVAEQVWGFEVINGKRYHTRRILSANTKGEYVLGRLVYSFVGRE
ncbi:hypothetical protein ASPSYDRAFT_204800 [Aspergillus sydowii CBS 593.65]|uniref:Uncharacterized protein n=1 Tax=Aspergillus sydowii CBS 593.65 TaxID=1036612 RepID=A0A1L9TDB8_9EURO|nr:uncharacterized protein ASPSYDRAFT_204800 [Aspergillus sydowii CBS 593.65]OJJ57417.1 hypothetical protein ASPSYDRAFT_204800 [Aspergillus sydowii CBS 593.65]